MALPKKNGLYDPQNEKDSCGVAFVAHIKGQRSHQLILDAAEALDRMTHRGACGCEDNSGDGAGILTALPHAFLAKVAKKALNVDLPPQGLYAAGLIFLPTDPKQAQFCKDTVEQLIGEQSQKLVGWRDVPVDAVGANIGPTPLASQPKIVQLFVAAGEGFKEEAFERQLYMIRKRSSHQLRGGDHPEAKTFYICSLSTKVMVYKGQLMPQQVVPYFTDLADPDYTTHLAMVHSRFSTNTFPSWDRAQPCRFMSHNGEINTLRGNINWVTARQGVMQSQLFSQQDLEKLFPIIEADCSDSGSFDNVLELLLMAGRSIPQAVMMMVPEAWQNHHAMSKTKRAFYEYHSALMEPWDGPASICFTDGHYIGAVLDRNGLRPSRYYVTHDDVVIMASEVGVVDVPPARVKIKGRLQPGKMFLVDFEQGRIIEDEELKEKIASEQPYIKWLAEQRIEIDELHAENEPHGFDPDTLMPRLRAFGYTAESIHFMLGPLVTDGRDPVGSMGNDAALACLSDKPRLVYDYFKQLFAQVTNPPIDSIREEVIMSLECFIGPEGSLLETTQDHVHRLRIAHPILTNEEAAALEHMDHRDWKSKVIDVTFDKTTGQSGMIQAIDRINAQATQAIADGYKLVVLSDRAISKDRVPVSMLLAVGALHQYLVKTQQRTQLGIIVETGEAREVHHHCLLIGFGADAINPYLAFESVFQARIDGILPSHYDDKQIVAGYRKSVAKGMLKVMAKMGISTLQSYKGAQIFEAVGLNSTVIEKCFTGTASRIQGVGFDVLAHEILERHAKGYPHRKIVSLPVLENNGDYHYRKSGEKHSWNPETIASIQQAARTGDRKAYDEFATLINEKNKQDCFLRGLLDFDFDPQKEIDIDQVEPASQIVKRFATGAMSYGSISKESHEALAIAMNRIGGKSNTGEGGEDYARFKTMPNGDSKRSAIKQVASGRFGVTSYYLTNADEIQIKMAQGAKPGEGGELPGHKVDQTIAATRHSTPGVGLISPPPHHDIYSIEDLAQLIFDLKNANRKARISVKLVSEVGVGTIAAGVAKGHADHILIAGHDGGTGASPLTSIKHAGLPWELGLAETHQTLVLNDLRSRVVIQTDGQLKTGRDVVIAALLGAEEYGFATAPLITLGCIMMRKCHLNTCPVGIATQDPQLREKFSGKPEHLVNYLFMVAEEARQIMAKLGFTNINQMIGRVDKLKTAQVIEHWKSQGLDMTPILAPAIKPHAAVEVYHTKNQDHALEKVLDRQLIAQSAAAISHAKPVIIQADIVNTDRSVGAMLSNEISKVWEDKGLPQDTITINLKGHAGQSLGAFTASGVTINLQGDANDYVGKGLSGGRIAIFPPSESTFIPEQNVILGNVALYGAVKGQAYFRGLAAERFCVRNSGASAVVEGVGDHALEYMTGGRAVILGPTGRNFAAGMSGGIAYVYDPDNKLIDNLNKATVEIEQMVDPVDIGELLQLIKNHQELTESTVAQTILKNWDASLKDFKKIIPTDYKRALEQIKQNAEKEAREKMPAV